MKSKVIKKLLIGMAITTSLLAIVPLLTANQIFLSPVENDFIEQLKDKIDSYYNALPEDRVYLQTDKTLYKPGESIWLSSYLLDGKTLKPSTTSEILHVELISPSGNIAKKLDLISKKGRSSANIDLGKHVPGGQYTLRAYTNWQKNEKDTLFFSKKLTVQKIILPRIKMKLDFQRESFGPGDMCIAKIDLENNTNEVMANYEFEYQVKVKNKEILRETVKTGNDGAMYIEFDLPKKLKTSDVILTALIPYQNQTESISRSVPIVLNDIQIDFMPEGGDLVYNLPSNVAFRAYNETGKPVDVEGIVFNSDDEEVCTLKSYHFGMGAFALTPKSNTEYYVKITKPVSIDNKFVLPEVISAGYVLNVKNNKKDLGVIIQSSVSEHMHLVMQSRGKIIYSSEYDVAPGANRFNIATEKLPIGVSQLTVFDSYGIARAERLVFLNDDKQLNISLRTNKEKYTPREKVKLSIQVSDDRGIPIPASLSLSVVNDQLLSFADDKSGTIVSQLLLEQDLDRPVHEPAFYFDKKEAKATQALDFLLMTSGWRRFTWKELIDEEIPTITFNGEKTIISGRVLNKQNKGVENAIVKILQDKLSVKTDGNGNFSINNVDLFEVKTLAISAKDLPTIHYAINEYKDDYTFPMYHKPHREVALLNNMAFPRAPQALKKAKAMVMDDEVFAVEDAAVQQVEKGNDNVAEPLDDDLNAAAGLHAPAMEELENMVDAVEVQEIMVRGGRVVADEIFMDGIAVKDNRFRNKNKEANVMRQAVAKKKVIYQQSREFSAPVYDQKSSELKREDFRSTIFWDGIIEIDRTGKSMIEFYTSDEITSFKAIVEGTSSTGEVGRAETVIYNQLPVSIDVKLPNQVITSDKCYLPLTLTNNTEESINGALRITHPKGLKYIGTSIRTVNLSAGESKTISLKYDVIQQNDSAVFAIQFKGPNFEDEISKVFEIIPQGFPAQVSFSAQDLNSVHNVELKDVVKGSVRAQLTAYPSVVGDLLSGVESILRMPSGCFEQTSMSSYPNILVMDYLKTTENEDKKLMARASNLLDKGYTKLITFETSKKGYDWFGRAPANEALTAYGLMQFNDMKAVSNIDQGMIDRTADWLMSRKDGEGGFLKHNSAADSYGRASKEITDAYIVYALTEAGYKKLDKEINQSYQMALKSNDAYLLALMANTMIIIDEESKSEKLMKALLSLQQDDGSFTGNTHSITRSGGKSLSIETTSIALMAMLKTDVKYRAEINKSVDWLIKQRSGHGAFGNTQGTILALKALTSYAKKSKKIASSGEIEILVDGFVVETQKYNAGSKEVVSIQGLEKYFKNGKNRIRVRFKDTDSALPFTILANWNTTLPYSSKDCDVKLAVNFAKPKVMAGENIRMNAKISNVTNKGLASPIAIIGIPAGLSLQSWQLDEMQEEGQFDFYEIVDNNIIIYLRQLAPGESKEYNFDLKADITGTYQAAASCAYLYYTNEHKYWTTSKSVSIETAKK